MRIDELPSQFDSFVDRAGEVLRWEVERAKKAAAAVNSERDAAQKALTEIQDQHEAAQKQLKAVLDNLHKGTTLAGLTHEIGENRKVLEKLKTDIAKATTALEAVQKQHKDAEQQIMAANDALRGLRQERSDAKTEIDNIRKLVKSFA
jgi:chromosome segregation ATPase